MPQLIQFDYDEDRLRAIEALDETDETYGGVPPRRFIVTAAAAKMLGARGIRFRVVGERLEEEPDHGTCP